MLHEAIPQSEEFSYIQRKAKFIAKMIESIRNIMHEYRGLEEFARLTDFERTLINHIYNACKGLAIAIEDLEEMYRKIYDEIEKAKAREIIDNVKTAFKSFLDEASRYKMCHL